MQEYGGKIPPADQGLLDDMKECVTLFNRSLVEALAYVDERKPSMVLVLDKNVKETLEGIQVRATWLAAYTSPFKGVKECWGQYPSPSTTLQP